MIVICLHLLKLERWYGENVEEEEGWGQKDRRMKKTTQHRGKMENNKKKQIKKIEDMWANKQTKNRTRNGKNMRACGMAHMERDDRRD